MRLFRKRMARSLLPLVIAASWLPGSSAASGAEDCLRIEGSTSISIPNPTKYENALVAEKDQTVQLKYQLTPQGSRPLDRAPVDVMLALDSSGSLNYNFDGSPSRFDAVRRNRLVILKENASALVDKLKEVNLKDQVGLVTFDNYAELKQSLTTDYAAVKREIGWMEAQYNTNVADGLKVARKALAQGKNAKKFIVLITDGDANLPAPGAKAKSAARSEAEQSARENMAIFTVAMGDGQARVTDLTLLKDIASMTHGATYTATNSNQLTQVFNSIANEIKANNKLTGITITQQLPDGFVLADNADSRITQKGKTLTIPVDNIPYPFDTNALEVSVPIKQTASAGHFTFDKPRISYTNACLAAVNEQLNNQAKISVLVKIRDTYGNTYYGDASGKVSRHSADTNEMQWQITEVNAPVAAIRFKDADLTDGALDHTIASVDYGNGEHSEWNLTPTSPTLVVKDANKEEIQDAEWHKGDGSFEISGAGNQLPESTVYGTNAFKDGSYISGYQYAINGGEWKAYQKKVVLEAGDKNVNVRALTNAVGSKAKPAVIRSKELNRSVKLDSSEPIVQQVDSAAADKADRKVSITMQEDISPITSYSVKLDSNEIMANTGNIGTDEAIDFLMTDKIAERDQRIGWHKVIVTARSAGGEQNSEHFVLVNPGPTLQLEAVNYNSGFSNKPVKVSVNYSHPVTHAYDENHPAPTIKEVKYAITKSDKPPKDSEWTDLKGKQFILTQDGDRTDYYVHVKVVDSWDVAESKHKLIQINYNQKRY